MLSAAAVPAIIGVVLLVMSSSTAVPLSLPASRSGVEGAAGAVVSTVMVSAAEAAPELPAVSVPEVAAVREWIPSERVVVSMDQLPDPSVVAVPTAPSTFEDRVTVLPASAVPVNCGVVSLVMLSSSSVPESLRVSKSGTEGAGRPVVSIVSDKAIDASLNPLPSPSSALVVME